MKSDHRVLISICIISAVFFPGCGRDTSSPAQRAPVLSNLSYAPNQAAQGSGGGTVTVYATVDAADPNANMSTFTVISFDVQGNIIHTSTDAIPFASGHTTRSFVATASFDTSATGNYTFTICVTDSTGLRSNALTGTISII
jgi:hypothetical protein